MDSFKTIEQRVAKRFGGAAKLARELAEPKSDKQLKAVADDRYLSLMSLRIFRAGLKHSLVDGKWPAFEQAFAGFVPTRVTLMSDEDVERLMGDARLIRHWAKLKSVRDNAAALVAIARAHGSFGAYIAGWPATRIVELWAELAKRFTQMGGNSGPSFLRMVGKDTFILTDDVVAALIAQDVVARKPGGKKDLQTVQEAFNAWSEQSSRPLCQISKILALSVG